MPDTKKYGIEEKNAPLVQNWAWAYAFGAAIYTRLLQIDFNSTIKINKVTIMWLNNVVASNYVTFGFTNSTVLTSAVAQVSQRILRATNSQVAETQDFNYDPPLIVNGSQFNAVGFDLSAVTAGNIHITMYYTVENS